jgi:hypothetical protein
MHYIYIYYKRDVTDCLLAACAELHVTSSAGTSIVHSIAILLCCTLCVMQACSLLDMTAIPTLDQVINPEHSSERYLVHGLRCQGTYRTASSDSAGDALTKEWRPEACGLLPVYFLGSSFARAQVGACIALHCSCTHSFDKNFNID